MNLIDKVEEKQLKQDIESFNIGDAVKVLAAAMLLPAAWKIVDRLRD